MTLEEVKKSLETGKTIRVNVWTFTGAPDVYGTCGEDNCCEWNFNTVEEFYNDFKEHYDFEEIK